jgi:hypothetical protein
VHFRPSERQEQVAYQLLQVRRTEVLENSSSLIARLSRVLFVAIASRVTHLASLFFFFFLGLGFDLDENVLSAAAACSPRIAFPLPLPSFFCR